MTSSLPFDCFPQWLTHSNASICFDLLSVCSYRCLRVFLHQQCKDSALTLHSGRSSFPAEIICFSLFYIGFKCMHPCWCPELINHRNIGLEETLGAQALGGYAMAIANPSVPSRSPLLSLPTSYWRVEKLEERTGGNTTASCVRWVLRSSPLPPTALLLGEVAASLRPSVRVTASASRNRLGRGMESALLIIKVSAVVLWWWPQLYVQMYHGCPGIPSTINK